MLKTYLVGHLVQDAGNAKEQQGPSVAQHLAQQFAVDAPTQFAHLGQETQRDAGCTHQVHHKHIAHLIVGVVPSHQTGMPFVQAGSHQKHKEVQSDIAEDKQQFQRGKLPRPPLEPEQREEDGLESIDCHHTAHHGHILGMCLVAHRTRHGPDKHNQQRYKQRRHRPYRQRSRREDPVGPFAVLVGKEEERRLHAKGENHQQKSRVGINLRHHAISARRGGNLVRVERHKQIVQKTPHYAAQSVSHRVRKQTFQRVLRHGIVCILLIR